MSHDATLARFAAHLARERDETSFTERLCEVSRTMLRADGSVVTVQLAEGRHTVCASDERATLLDKLQDLCGQGPAVDATELGTVVVADFAEHEPRWPHLSDLVAAEGFEGTVLAVPLRAELPLEGTLTVHHPGPPRPEDEPVARFLGGAVGTALLQDATVGARDHVLAEVLGGGTAVTTAAEHLQDATGVCRADALVVLRAIAFLHDGTLVGAAEAVLEGRFPLLEGA